MKICRIGPYPSEESPGAGLVPYFLSLYIEEPTLYVTQSINGFAREVPSHVRLRSFRGNKTPIDQKMRRIFFDEMRSPYGLGLQLKLAGKLKGTGFALRSLPSITFFKPHIIHCHGIRNIYNGTFSHLFRQSKFILGLHNETEVIVIKKMPILQFLINRYCDAIICVSQYITNQLQELITIPIFTVPTGVDLRFFKPSNIAREKRISAIGSFKWKKGYSDMLGAFKMVSDAFPDYKFTIVGKGEEKNRIVRIIKELNLSGVVEIVSQLDYSGIRDLLSRSKVFVLSSIYEGFPKVVLEAMACGTPVVVTNKCNVSSLIARGVGIETPAGNPQEHSRAIKDFLSDHNRWTQASCACIEVVQDYDWKNIAQITYKIYQQLLS